MRHVGAIICILGCRSGRESGHAAGRSSRHRNVEGRFGGGDLIPDRNFNDARAFEPYLNNFVWDFISRFSDQKLPK